LSGSLWRLGPFGGQGGSGLQVVILLGFASFLARGFLIVETVHNDPLPGVRQDWLVRPIRRGELLAAKVLFTILVVQTPVFAGDLMESLADGFSFGASINVAFSRSLLMLITFSLPVLALSAVTKGLLEVLTSPILGVAILAIARSLVVGAGETQRLTETGLEWMVQTFCLLTVVELAAVVLTMQFRRRLTVPSRWVTAAGAVLVYAIMCLPWQQVAFAWQSHLSPAPGAARGVEIAFEPNWAPLPSNQRYGGWAGRTILRVPLTG